jgi:anti-sigma factor RsiW
MNVCADRRETLLLDVHGELPTSEREAWQTHLDACPGCCQERRELLRVIEDAREAMPLPILAPEQANALRELVRRNWRAERAPVRWQRFFFGLSPRPGPALAAAGLVLALLGWFGFHELQTAYHTRRAPEAPAQIMVSDADVIENLDFLEQMDDIERVVQVVDHRDIVL